MSDDDNKGQAAKAGAERLVEELFGTATRSLECGNLSPGDEDLLADGRASLVRGYRDLMRIIDGKHEGCEAIQHIMRGAALIGCTAIYTASQKDFIAHRLGSIGGKKSAEKKKPDVKARHDNVLLLMQQIESETPRRITREKLAIKIEEKLPTLGHSQILKIMRAAKKVRQSSASRPD
jgi:hypothetical protein